MCSTFFPTLQLYPVKQPFLPLLILSLSKLFFVIVSQFVCVKLVETCVQLSLEQSGSSSTYRLAELIQIIQEILHRLALKPEESPVSSAQTGHLHQSRYSLRNGLRPRGGLECWILIIQFHIWVAFRVLFFGKTKKHN